MVTSPVMYSPVSSEMSWWVNSRSQWQQPLKNDGFLSANAFGVTLVNGELSVKSAFVHENAEQICVALGTHHARLWECFRSGSKFFKSPGDLTRQTIAESLRSYMGRAVQWTWCSVMVYIHVFMYLSWFPSQRKKYSRCTRQKKTKTTNKLISCV